MSENPDDNLGEALLQAIKRFTDLVPHVNETTANLAKLEQQSVQLENYVKTLYRILLEGNGQPSLSTQISELQTQLQSLNQTMDILRKNEDTRLQERVKEAEAKLLEEKRRKRVEWTTVIAASIAALATIVTAMIGYYAVVYKAIPPH